MSHREALREAARSFHGRGWMVGTSGNLSARRPDGTLWITASGRSKGALGDQDFLRLGPDGSVRERFHAADRPSAETSLHLAVYALTGAGAVFHVHTVEANLVASMALGDRIRLPPLEMLKGFGIWEHEPEVWLDVLENHLFVPEIADDVQALWARTTPQVPAFLIRNHGITTWGHDVEEATNRLELLDYVFRYMVAARSAGMLDRVY